MRSPIIQAGISMENFEGEKFGIEIIAKMIRPNPVILNPINTFSIPFDKFDGSFGWSIF